MQENKNKNEIILGWLLLLDEMICSTVKVNQKYAGANDNIASIDSIRIIFSPSSNCSMLNFCTAAINSRFTATYNSIRSIGSNGTEESICRVIMLHA